MQKNNEKSAARIANERSHAVELGAESRIVSAYRCHLCRNPECVDKTCRANPEKSVEDRGSFTTDVKGNK